MRYDSLVQRGTLANRPAAADVVIGTLYCVSDADNHVYRSTGSAWESFSSDIELPIDLTSDVTGALPVANVANSLKTRTIFVDIGDGTNVITTGIKGDISFDVACTISAWRILSTVSGSIVIDIWKDTLANFPPDNSDSITNGHEPTLTTATNAEDTDLSDWTTLAIAVGNILRFNVDSVTSCTKVKLQLKVTLT